MSDTRKVPKEIIELGIRQHKSRNEGRELTLHVVITDQEKANRAFWANHAENLSEEFGYVVHGLADGNIISERDRYNELLGEVTEYLAKNINDAEGDELLDKLLDVTL